MRDSKTVLLICFYLAILQKDFALAQKVSLPVLYEELTSPEFVQAIEFSQKTCIIPLGILEKHATHLPLGTDLLIAREIAIRAAKLEYTVVFPSFYFGQIFEAKHQPGTVAYSHELMWKILEETCDELARNGFRKIILVNGHGGNNSFVSYFCQAQLAKTKNYAVILFTESDDPEVLKKVNALRKTTGSGHADEVETSMVLSFRSDLVHPEKAKDQSGEDLKRLEHIKNMYTAIWWYARFPNHYAGNGSFCNKEIGELLINSSVSQLVDLIKTIKKDKTILELQQEFYNKAENPLQTK